MRLSLPSPCLLGSSCLLKILSLRQTHIQPCPGIQVTCPLAPAQLLEVCATDLIDERQYPSLPERLLEQSFTQNLLKCRGMWFSKLKCSCSFCFSTLKTPGQCGVVLEHWLWSHRDLGLNLDPATFHWCDFRQVTLLNLKTVPHSLKKIKGVGEIILELWEGFSEIWPTKTLVQFGTEWMLSQR